MNFNGFFFKFDVNCQLFTHSVMIDVNKKRRSVFDFIFSIEFRSFSFLIFTPLDYPQLPKHIDFNLWTLLTYHGNIGRCGLDQWLICENVHWKKERDSDCRTKKNLFFSVRWGKKSKKKKIFSWLIYLLQW